MAKIKKQDCVTLRSREAKGGRQSLYLDIYQKGKRIKKSLGLFLEPGNSKEVRLYNAEITKEAKKRKAKAEVEAQTQKLKVVKTPNTFLAQYVRKVAETKSRAVKNKLTQLCDHLVIFRKNAKLRDINADFITKFIDYLASAKSRCSGKQISHNTARQYLSAFNTVLRKAFRNGDIDSNPFDQIERADKKKISGKPQKRAFLTEEELKKLIKTPETESPYDYEKAFIFCCYTGLRISDVAALRWTDITKTGDDWTINIKMLKTGEEIEIPIPEEAKKYMPERKGENVIFRFPSNLSNASIVIKRWAKEAGIKKNVTFHVSRHTFATNLISLGGDLYVVSELLGHADIKTTKIYAEVVNKRKMETIKLMNQIKL